MIREETVKEKMHDPGLPDPAHIFRPPGNDALIGPDRRKTVGHTGFAEEAFKKRVFEIRVDFEVPFGQLADMNIVAPGHVPFISRDIKDRAMSLAETAAVAFGDFLVYRLELFVHGKPRV
jgi:hypothetical protein